MFDGCSQGIEILSLGDHPVDSILHKILWTANIRDNDRQSTCLRLDNDITEGIRGAWENKEISRGIGTRQLFLVEASCVNSLGK